MSLPVLIVEDHPLFRAGFAVAWARGGDRPKLVAVGDAAAALAAVRRQHFGVAIVDLLLPDACGLGLVAPLAAAGATVVLLTTYVRPAVVHAARRLGAAAVLSKELDPDVILMEIERLMRRPAPPASAEALDLPRFTQRELDVLAGVLGGSSNPEIAAALGIGTETVKTHVSAIMEHLGVRNRIEVTRAARDLGFDLALPYLGDVTGSS